MVETPSLDTIFCAAIEIAAEADRAAYLAAACGHDAELRARVEKLVAAHFRAGNFLEQPAPAPTPTGAPTSAPPEAPLPAAVAEQPGTIIGPYKLIQEIGEGGMGTVWMAQQTEPVKRVVALKVIKPGMDSKQVLARFDAERQALALMDHPHIAKVLDAGATAAGRPFFVMELVKGVPLTKYCDEHRLTPKQRLELFIPVCQAIQHAHQKGIIHRDIKPSNVLVALYDGKPVPKVIDFGIAKATGQQLTERTLVTGFGAVVGTLEYMSPEQAELNQLDIDTRSDIYSLGVMLYELLTGSTPLEKKRLKQAAMLEVLRIIREEEPPRPSTRLSTTEELPSVAANRGLEPKKLSGVVRGELDWIVMKALEKDRNRRYETANGFALDVQRYLADEPVQACPPSVWYRLRKFARRNKTGLASAGLILLFIAVLGSVGGWVVFDRAAREQRLTAQVEMILDEVDRLEREQKWPEAQAAADRAAAVLGGGKADEPVRQRVRDVLRDLAFVARLDRIQQDRGICAEGSGFDVRRPAQGYRRAFQEYGIDVERLAAQTAVATLQARPELAAPLAAALDDWVDCRRGLGEGEPSWAPLVVVARGLDPDPLRDRLRAAWGRRVTPELQGELRRLTTSIDVQAESPATLQVFARTLAQAGMPDSAVQVLRDGHYAHPADFLLSFTLGFVMSYRKDYAEAVRYCSVAVSIRPDSGAAHNNLGTALHGQKKLDEAIACFRKAIDLDPKNAGAHSNLGYALRDQRKLDDAVAECRRAIDLDPKLAQAHNTLGLALRDQKKLDEAIACFRKAIDLEPKLASAHYNFGLALHDQKKLDGAVAEYRQAIDLDPKLVQAHNNLALALRDQGELAEAVAECRKAIDLDPKDTPAHYNLGIALHDQGKLDEAIAEWRKAIALDPKLVLAHISLGNGLQERGKLDEAIAEHCKAIALDPKDAVAHVSLGNDLTMQGKLDEAIAEYHQALRLKKDFAQARNNLRLAEYLAQLTKRLPAVRDGKDHPKDAAERVAFARLCQFYRREYAAAVRFYADAFAAEPKLAEVLDGDRYNAACVAALGGCGRGNDADKMDEKEKARLRGEALAWLRADLEALGRLLHKEVNQAPIAAGVAGTLKHWQEDPDLAGVRGSEAMVKLPVAERQAWHRLWDDVADLLAHAQAKTTPEKKRDAK